MGHNKFNKKMPINKLLSKAECSSPSLR